MKSLVLLARLGSGLAMMLATNVIEVANAQELTETEEVTVSGEAISSLTSPTMDQSHNIENQTPGAVTIKRADEMKLGRASNFEDLLQRTPGIFLQSENGAEVSKISIRGSGITSEDEPIGIMFLLDGLNYNQGDGETILEDFDVTTISHAEIFRGADAFNYGALTLGGAINLIPFTGYDSSPLQARVEAGSFGYFRTQLSSGRVEGPLDQFASISGRSRDGFRDHSSENSEIGFVDLGYKIRGNIENRIYLTLDRTDRDLPGGLTKSEMENSPERANPFAIAQDWNKDWNYIRMADKLTAKIDDSEFDAGLFWFHRDLEQRGFFATDFRQGIEMFYSDNVGATITFSTRAPLLNHRNLFTIGLSPQREDERSQNFENIGGHAGATTARGDVISLNLPIYAEDQLYFTEQFSIVAGFQAIFAERRFRDEFVSDAEGDQSHLQDFFGFNPKIGAIYAFDRRTQAFFNISRSWQPPSFNNLLNFADGPNSSVVYTPLNPQHAWTAELGTRGHRQRIDWELSLYRSWIRNELLDLNDRFGNSIGTVNARRTIHQGVEAALDLNLFDHLFFPPDASGSADRVSLKQAYTFNDFQFSGDSVYGDNRVAGIPVHFYQAQLLYEMPSGFYAGPAIDCNLTRYPVDHANTLFADAYALVGFRTGYRRQHGLSVFIDCKNLSDKHYPSSIDVIADARKQPNPEIFHPGDGRSVYAGVSWNW
jgi:iron complex outermembrane recepter protein